MATYPGPPGWLQPKRNLSVGRKVSRTEAISARRRRRKKRAMQKKRSWRKLKKTGKMKKSLDPNPPTYRPSQLLVDITFPSV